MSNSRVDGKSSSEAAFFCSCFLIQTCRGTRLRRRQLPVFQIYGLVIFDAEACDSPAYLPPALFPSRAIASDRLRQVTAT